MAELNSLYFGDCLTVMEQLIPSGSVDLIYLDPPFNSQRQYNAIYKDETGRELPDQIDAFADMWELNEVAELAIREMPIRIREAGISDEVAEFWRVWVKALRGTQPRLLAYLSYMVPRLLRMRNLLKPTGSIYYHCDPTASHYVKVMMDGIFGHDNFQNEIIWQRTSAHSDAGRFGSIHDIILFYSRGDRKAFNSQFLPYDDDHLKRFRREDDDGRMET